MPIKRTYAEHGDACATAHAVELLGDRWVYPVLREVLLGPKRFRELVESVRGITPAVLTSRLRDMEQNGLLARRQLPAPASLTVYEATPWATELSPVFESLGRWAQRSPSLRQDGCGLTPDSAVQSMLTMAPRRQVRPSLEVHLHLHDARLASGDGYDYLATWGEGLQIVRVYGTPEAGTTIRGDSTTWAGILYEGAPLGQVEIDGDRDEAERLVTEFWTP